jgi:hypothetical protein
VSGSASLQPLGAAASVESARADAVARVARDIEELAAITDPGVGVNRIAYTERDREGAGVVRRAVRRAARPTTGLPPRHHSGRRSRRVTGSFFQHHGSACRTRGL